MQINCYLLFRTDIAVKEMRGNSRKTYDNNQQVALTLTPPNTQKEATKLTNGTDDSMAFLRAYFHMEHQLRCWPTDPLSENVVRRSVLSVLQRIDRSVESCSDLAQCFESLRMCVRLLDSQVNWPRSVSDRFTEAVCRWLQSVNRGRNAEKYFTLLQIVTESNLAPVLADLIVKRISNSQQILKEWHFDGGLIPRPILHDFMNSSHFFLLFEKTIPRLSMPARRKHLATFSDINSNVQLHFPLFAASMMHCAHELNLPNSLS